MVLGQLNRFTNDDPWRSNTFFSLMLVALEKIVEYDFVCPCKKGYTEIVFFFYLLMPMLIAIFFGIYLQMSTFWKKSKRKESGSCSKIKQGCLRFLAFVAPPAVWVALFLSDGRYVSCYKTKLKAGYADSNDKPPWEWCSKTRNLTDDQNQVHTGFYWSKFGGFFLIFLLPVIFFLAAVCKYNNKESDQQSNQPDTERPIRAGGEVNEPLQEL